MCFAYCPSKRKMPCRFFKIKAIARPLKLKALKSCDCSITLEPFKEFQICLVEMFGIMPHWVEHISGLTFLKVKFTPLVAFVKSC